MYSTFSATVSALVYSAIDEHCRIAGETDRALNNRVVDFILGQHRRMPDYLRLPLTLLTVAFDLWSVPAILSTFSPLHCPLESRPATDTGVEAIAARRAAGPSCGFTTIWPCSAGTHKLTKAKVCENLHRDRDTLRTRVAVIGSGPGGAITATLLAEAGREVLLVEEGPHLPLESCEPFSRQEMVQKYRNGGLTA